MLGAQRRSRPGRRAAGRHHGPGSTGWARRWTPCGPPGWSRRPATPCRWPRAVTEMAPVADRRRFHARLARRCPTAGRSATRTGEHLAAAGAQGATVAAAYVAAGDATLAEAPEPRRAGTSGHLAAGTPAPAIAACRPRPPRSAATRRPCAWRTPWATRRRGPPPCPGGGGAAARRGPGAGRRPAAEPAALPAGDRNDAAWPLLATIAVATGGPLEPAAAGDGDGERERPASRSSPCASMPGPAWSASEAAAAAGADPGGGRAAGVGPHPPGPPDLAPRGGHRGPGAVRAGDRRAPAGPGPRPRRRRCHLRHHHRLGLGWVAVRSGRWSGAQAALDEVAGATLAPWRSWWRRPSRRAWLAARATWPGWATPGPGPRVSLRHPADLFSLEIVGELAIGAARLGLWDRVAPKGELGDVVRSPWASRRCGCCRCAGSACRWRWPPTTGRRRSAGPPRWRRPSPCTHDWERWRPPAPGWRSWAATPTRGRGAAADGLQELGLTWEASRLTGQAAIRSADPSVTRPCWSRPVT